MYAIIAAHFTENWGVYTMITQLPAFLTGLKKYSFSRYDYNEVSNTKI